MPKSEMEQVGQMITATELAIVLGVSERSVWKLLERKQLPEPIRLNRSVRWNRHGIDDFLKNHRRNKTPSCPRSPP